MMFLSYLLKIMFFFSNFLLTNWTLVNYLWNTFEFLMFSWIQNNSYLCDKGVRVRVGSEGESSDYPPPSLRLLRRAPPNISQSASTIRIILTRWRIIGRCEGGNLPRWQYHNTQFRFSMKNVYFLTAESLISKFFRSYF